MRRGRALDRVWRTESFLKGCGAHIRIGIVNPRIYRVERRGALVNVILEHAPPQLFVP